MKLLIIAGPYEADRIRKAAVAGGFEAVAVEPGESLSGWITASRPEVIVMAPQMVHPDPAMALAKVRAVPRGRVPIFFVGDSGDESRMSGLADGFFVRPISPEELVERARTLLTEGKDKSNGARRRPRTSEGLGPFTHAGPEPGTQAARPPAGLKPLRASPSPSPTLPKLPTSAYHGPDPSLLLADLTNGIDALMDDELSNVIAAPTLVTESPAHDVAAPTQVTELPAHDIAAPTQVTEPPAHDIAAPTQVTEPPAHDFNDEQVTQNSRPAQPAPADRDTLLARAALVDEGDYFEVLGVARDATAAELQSAHERIARQLSPEAIDAALSAELGDRLDTMREVVAEALRVLMNDHLRSRYLAHLG